MIEAVSCGGVVIYKWKILLLYKNQNGRYMGWVLPKGTVEEGETYRQTALREVKEESGANGEIIKYVGKTQYTFKGSEDTVNKTVHWYLMSANSFYCKPQSEEYFADAGFYKFHEATPNLDGLKEKIIVLKDGEDRKTLIAVIALVAAVLIAVTAGVVYLLKTRMDDEYEEDWDYDWDDLDDEFCEDDECCCTDKDVDNSVKVEQA